MTPEISRYYADLFDRLGMSLSVEDRLTIAHEVATLISIDGLSQGSRDILDRASVQPTGEKALPNEPYWDRYP